jgi:hypothetical protein
LQSQTLLKGALFAFANLKWVCCVFLDAILFLLAVEPRPIENQNHQRRTHPWILRWIPGTTEHDGGLLAQVEDAPQIPRAELSRYHLQRTGLEGHDEAEADLKSESEP